MARRTPWPLALAGLALVAVSHAAGAAPAAETGPAPESELPDFEVEAPVESLLVEEADAAGPPFLRWAEARYGWRTQASDINQQTVMNEFRAQVGQRLAGQGLALDARADLLLDGAMHQALIDLRELNLSPTMLPAAVNITFGRQIINWMMGDILQLNDLFPKDFTSYFMGRDAEGEYMKAPSDAVQINLAHKLGTLDIVYAPSFKPYTIPTGPRLSYYSPFTQRIEGEDNPLPTRTPDQWFADDVWSARYATKLGQHEFFVFFNDGYWTVPNAIDSAAVQAYYTRMRTFGAAWRGPLLNGLLTLEGSWYDSLEDLAGDDPNIPNSQIRGLVRYDRELMKNLNMTAQYYIEHRRDQAAYEDSLPASMTAQSMNYEELTLRLTRTLLKQTVNLSFFAFYSPTEDDYYLRANLQYQPGDHWLYHIGANYFGGGEDDTRWGQYRNNSNLFIGVRRYW